MSTGAVDVWRAQPVRGPSRRVSESSTSESSSSESSSSEGDAVDTSNHGSQDADGSKADDQHWLEDLGPEPLVTLRRIVYLVTLSALLPDQPGSSAGAAKKDPDGLTRQE